MSNGASRLPRVSAICISDSNASVRPSRSGRAVPRKAVRSATTCRARARASFELLVKDGSRP